MDGRRIDTALRRLLATLCTRLIAVAGSLKFEYTEEHNFKMMNVIIIAEFDMTIDAQCTTEIPK